MTLSQSIKIMRVICPLMVVATASLAAWAYSESRFFSMAINCVCVGVNIILSVIQWRVFKI